MKRFPIPVRPGLVVAMALLSALLVSVAAQFPASASNHDLEHRVVVPAVAHSKFQPVTYSTRPGDTLAIVATLYGTSVEVLQELNDLPNEDEYAELPATTLLLVPKPPPPPAMLPCEDLLGPVSKDHALPADCTPAGQQLLPVMFSYGGDQYLDPRAADAFEEMAEDALDAGHHLRVRSSYRDFIEQRDTFEYWVDELGYEEAIRVSAPPGHSEHQLGTAADVTTEEVRYELTTEFGETATGQWVASNAWRYGFVISYPDGAEEVTGYAYEPWHIRWVGLRVAGEVRSQGVTLYEYLLEEWLPGRYLFGIY